MIDINELKSNLQIATLNCELRFLKNMREELMSEAEMITTKLYRQSLSHIIIQEALKGISEKLYDTLIIEEYLTAKEEQAKDLFELLSQKEKL